MKKLLVIFAVIVIAGVLLNLFIVSKWCCTNGEPSPDSVNSENMGQAQEYKIYSHDDSPAFTFRYQVPSGWSAKNINSTTIQFQPGKDELDPAPNLTVEIVEAKINRDEIQEIKTNEQGVEYFESTFDESGSLSGLSFLLPDAVVKVTLHNNRSPLGIMLLPEITETFSAR